MISTSMSSTDGYYGFRPQAKDLSSLTLIGTLDFNDPFVVQQRRELTERVLQSSLDDPIEFESRVKRSLERMRDSVRAKKGLRPSAERLFGAETPSGNGASSAAVVVKEDGFLIIDGVKMKVNEK